LSEEETVAAYFTVFC